jgi:hypothetical protein
VQLMTSRLHKLQKSKFLTVGAHVAKVLIIPLTAELYCVVTA